MRTVFETGRQLFPIPQVRTSEKASVAKKLALTLSDVALRQRVNMSSNDGLSAHGPQSLSDEHQEGTFYDDSVLSDGIITAYMQ